MVPEKGKASAPTSPCLTPYLFISPLRNGAQCNDAITAPVFQDDFMVICDAKGFCVPEFALYYKT